MSHFYASIKGSRGPATRCGTKSSGHHGHIRGWSAGVMVEAVHNSDADKDIFRIYATAGSAGAESSRLVGTVIGYHDGRGYEFIPAREGE